VVCERLKADPELADTRIIIVSGVVRQDEIDALLTAGADDFVAKPFDAEDLTTRIDALVGA